MHAIQASATTLTFASAIVSKVGVPGRIVAERASKLAFRGCAGEDTTLRGLRRSFREMGDEMGWQGCPNVRECTAGATRLQFHSQQIRKIPGANLADPDVDAPCRTRLRDWMAEVSDRQLHLGEVELNKLHRIGVLDHLPPSGASAKARL